MEKIADLNEGELVARIVADEGMLRKWHGPRLEHLEKTRLIRNLDKQASLMADDPLIKPLTALIISARPMVYWDWAVSTLAAQPFRYRNPYSTEARRWGQGKRSGAMIEYLAYGIEAQENEISGHTGEEPAARFDLARQVASGSYAFYPHAEKLNDAGSDIVFRRDFYDPAQVFWLPGRLGMQIVLRSFMTSLWEARQEIATRRGREDYLTGKDTALVQCIEAYYLEDGKVYNALVTVGGMKEKDRKEAQELALPLKLLKNCDYIPIICGCVNIADTAPSKEGTLLHAPQPTGEDVSERWGRSVLDPVIRAVQQSNVWRTLAHLSARQAINPTEVRETEGGAAPEEIPVGPGEQRKITVRAGSEAGIKYVPRPPAALDVSRESEDFNRELDLATVSPGIMGQTEPSVASGFLREGWEAITKAVKVGVYDEAIKEIEKRSKMQSIRIFGLMEGKTHLWGSHPLERKGLDGHFEGDYTPKQVPKGFWAIEVYRAPARPVDMAALGNEARARRLSGEISKRREREMIGIEDPDGEQEQIDLEAMDELPRSKAMKFVEARGQELVLLRDRIAAIKEKPESALPEEDVEQMERQADMLEAEYLRSDLELTMMGRTMTQAVQGPVGREAPQPNASPVAPMPGPGMQPPELRGEGKMQAEQKRMAGAPVGGP